LLNCEHARSTNSRELAGEISYQHLGGDFYRDPDGTLAWGAKTYCKRIVNQCESIFGAPPKEYTSPIDKDDHPELDTTDEAGPEDIKHYQSLIGSFQWAISLGRYDIYCATMSMGRFRAAPKIGHLIKRLNRICGYLKKYPQKALSVSVLRSQTILTWNMLNMNGPTVYTAIRRKKFLRICLRQEDNPSGPPLLKMPILCTILPLAVP
jgi:hypothetical protein